MTLPKSRKVFPLMLLLLILLSSPRPMQAKEQLHRDLQQNATIAPAVPALAATTSPIVATAISPTQGPTVPPVTASPTFIPTSFPTSAPTSPPDFTQINMLLETAKLMIPETTVSPEADVDGCGVLGAIDLEIELMVTEQVNEFLVGQELDIPTDLFQLGRRRALTSKRESTPKQKATKSGLHMERDLEDEDVCADAGNNDDEPLFSIDSILDMLRFQLELNLDDGIDDLLRDLEFDIPTTTIEFSDLLQTTSNQASADVFGAAEEFGVAAVTETVREALELSFGEELSDFIQQFEIELPDQEQQEVTLLSSLFNFNVTNVVCRDFGLQDLDVSVVFNGDITSIDSLDIELGVSGRDVTAVCTGDVVFGFTILRLRGSFEADLRFEDFDLGFRFVDGALSVTNCNTNLQVDNVDLSNVRILFIDVGDGFINAVFDFLQGFILNLLERFVNPLICNLINDGVAGAFGSAVTGGISDATEAGASALENPEGSLTLRKGRCNGFEVNGAFEVDASVQGLNIDANVVASNARVECSGQVLLDVLGIEAQAKFSLTGFADELELGIQFDGSDLSFDSCGIVAGVDGVDVNDLRVEKIDVPEELTDHTVSMVSEFVFSVVNDLLGDSACDVLDGSLDLPGFSPFGNPEGGGGTTSQGIDAQVELITGSCKDISVGDVSAGTNEKNDRVLEVDVDIEGVEVRCTGTLAFEFAGINGRLDFSTSVTVEKLLVDVFLVAETRLCEQFPSSGCVDSCRAKLSINDLQFSNIEVDDIPDSLVQVVADALEDPVRDVIESLAGDAICSALDGLAPGLIEDFLPAGDGTSQTFTLVDTVCDNLSLRSLTLSSSQPNDELVLLPLNLDNFGITCNGDLEVQLGQLSGSASFSVDVIASADIIFGIMSQNYSLFPPTNTSLDSCEAALTTNTATLSNLAIEGLPDLLLETLLGFVDGLIGTIIGEQGPSLLCGAVEDTSFLNNLLAQISDPVAENLPPRDVVDPLTTEAAFNATEVLLDFTGEQSSSIDFFASIITGPLLSPSFVVNTIISGLLNNDSAVVFDGSSLGLSDALNFETDFAVINATVGQISVFGLDSLSELGERVVYGNYTIGSTFKFDQIDLVVDLELLMHPKNDENALIGFTGEPILETVQVAWNTTDMAGNFSLFIALSVEDFAVVPPTALLTDSASVFPCLLASLEGLQLPQLEFGLDFDNPVITGFSSTGTERLAKGFIEALFLMYGDSLSLAMPGFSQNLLRPSLNDFLAGALNGEQVCPFTPSPTTPAPTLAAALLATNESPTISSNPMSPPAPLPTRASIPDLSATLLIPSPSAAKAPASVFDGGAPTISILVSSLEEPTSPSEEPTNPSEDGGFLAQVDESSTSFKRASLLSTLMGCVLVVWLIC